MHTDKSSRMTQHRLVIANRTIKHSIEFGSIVTRFPINKARNCESQFGDSYKLLNSNNNSSNSNNSPRIANRMQTRAYLQVSSFNWMRRGLSREKEMIWMIKKSRIHNSIQWPATVCVVHQTVAHNIRERERWIFEEVRPKFRQNDRVE